MRRHVRLLVFAGVFSLCAPAALFASWLVDGPTEAQAAISVAYTLDELVAQSPEVVVVKAVERHSVWEKVAGSKRIVTYTKLERLQAVYGSTAKTVWVRTLGGAVGRIGQHVAGEAQFSLGKKSLIFLTKTEGGTYVVSGTAQGHYPIVSEKADDKTVQKLTLSPNRGEIVKKKSTKESIGDALRGAEVDRGISRIKSAKARVDAKKRK